MRVDRSVVTRSFHTDRDLAGALGHHAGGAGGAAVNGARVPQAELRREVVRD